MAIPYLNIARAVVLRANQLGDAADAAALETLYTGALSSAVTGMEVPLTALKHTILACEKRWVERVARFGPENYKQSLYGRSIDLGIGIELPIVDNAAKEFIGPFSGVFDSIESTVQLTEAPEHVVRRAIRNQNRVGGPFKLEQYHYHLRGTHILHTRLNGAYVTGCSWSYSTQSTAYDASGNSPLPQALEVGWVAEVLENLPQENWFVSEASVYSKIRAAVEDGLRAGIEPNAQLPDATSTPEPVKN